MKTFSHIALFLLAAALVSGRAGASSPEFEAAWRKASEAYQERRFEETRGVYEGLLRQGFQSAELFYNLGNAYYQLDQRGKAAWMYEKALALAPRLSDARKNLSLARAGLPSAQNGAFFLFKPLEWLCRRLTAGEWAALFLVLSLLASICAALWILLRPGRARRLARLGAVLALSLLALTACFFVPRYIGAEWRHYGVVIEKGAIVRNAPNPQGEEYFEAAEGERFLVEESDLSGWMRVKHPATGRVGYLPESALGRI